MKAFYGKRSVVYCFLWFAVKVKRTESTAINRLANETYWLKILQQYHIGPRLYFFGKHFLILQRVRGERVLDFFTLASLEEKKFVVFEVLRQCRILDQLHVDKLEMHRPVKHILITKRKKVVMIDFERCKYAQKPKNVTQFIQFLPKLGIEFDKEKMRKRLQRYKNSYNGIEYGSILKLLNL